MRKQTLHFFNKELWELNINHYKLPIRGILKLLMILFPAHKNFMRDQGHMFAASLTYYSLLSIVPVFAVFFGIAKGFGFEALLESSLYEQFPQQEEVLKKIIEFSYSLLAHTQGGIVAGIGIITLFWSVFRILSNIETALNTIWKVKQGRSLGRKCTDYLTTILVCPFFFILSSGLNVFLVKFAKATEHTFLLESISPFVFALMKIIPFCLSWFWMTFLYIFLPNIKIPLKTGIIGGILSGTAYQLLQWIYIRFQIGVASYGAIYGSFAALPLFLIWLQISWMIILAGAEITGQLNKKNLSDLRPDWNHLNLFTKKFLYILIMHRCVTCFLKGEKPLTADDLSEDLEIPSDLIRDLLFELVEANQLLEVKNPLTNDIAFIPAQDSHKMTILSVISSIERAGPHPDFYLKNQNIKDLVDQSEAFNTKSDSFDTLLIKDLFK